MKGSKEQKKLVNGCIKGDRRCQQQLFKMFYGKMMVVCLRYAQNDAVAQDYCQEAFLKVFDRLKDFNHAGSLEGWIRRIMVTTSIDALRKEKKKFTELELEKVLADEDIEDEEEINAWEDLSFEELKKLIQNLTPAYRSVFNLYVIEEYSHKEIAEMLGISEGTSKSNLAKAKRNLRVEFEKMTSKWV